MSAIFISLVSLLLAGEAFAQIYTCTAEDGTRVFSDEKCGPDAKIVSGITSSKRPAASKPSSQPARPATPPKSPEELEGLAMLCNGGDVKACNEWTRSGGPKQLKADEQKLEQACESGSLDACEERYCIDGATQACRTRVFAAAGASGENWYLRSMGKRAEDGTTSYNIRCLVEGDLHMRDVVLTCAANAGPTRCFAGDPQAGSPTMSQAATKSCATR